MLVRMKAEYWYGLWDAVDSAVMCFALLLRYHDSSVLTMLCYHFVCRY